MNKPTLILTDRASFALRVKFEAHDDTPDLLVLKARSQKHRKPIAQNVIDAAERLGVVGVQPEAVILGSFYAIAVVKADAQPAHLAWAVDAVQADWNARKAAADAALAELDLGNDPDEDGEIAEAADLPAPTEKTADYVIEILEEIDEDDDGEAAAAK